MGTKFWLSTLVVNTSLRSVGMVVLRGIKRREDTTAGLDTERERRDVEEEHLHVATFDERRALQGGAGGDHLVGVHPLVRLATEELLHRLLHRRHARHAADKDDVLDVRPASGARR